MKKILTLTVAILAVLFTSCSKDKDNKTNPLIGEWALLSNVENGVDIKGICGEYTYIIFTETEIEVHSFKERVGCIEQIQKGGYTLSNNKIIFEANGEKSSASYVVNGDILTITSDSSGVVTTYKKNARKTPPPVVIPDPDTNPFVGTWALESIKIKGTAAYLDKCMIQSTYVFTDKTFQMNWVQEKDNSSDCETITTNISYTISGNKLILNQGNKTDEMTFSIEGDVLTLNGLTEDTKEPITMIFKKQ